MLDAKKMKEIANEYNSKEVAKIVKNLCDDIDKAVPIKAAEGEYRHTTRSIVPPKYKDEVHIIVREKYKGFLVTLHCVEDVYKSIPKYYISLCWG
jgi:hypothetical protein